MFKPDMIELYKRLKGEIFYLHNIPAFEKARTIDSNGYHPRSLYEKEESDSSEKTAARRLALMSNDSLRDKVYNYEYSSLLDSVESQGRFADAVAIVEAMKDKGIVSYDLELGLKNVLKIELRCVNRREIADMRNVYLDACLKHSELLPVEPSYVMLDICNVDKVRINLNSIIAGTETPKTLLGEWDLCPSLSSGSETKYFDDSGHLLKNKYDNVFTPHENELTRAIYFFYDDGRIWVKRSGRMYPATLKDLDILDEKLSLHSVDIVGILSGAYSMYPIWLDIFRDRVNAITAFRKAGIKYRDIIEIAPIPIKDLITCRTKRDYFEKKFKKYFTSVPACVNKMSLSQLYILGETAKYVKPEERGHLFTASVESAKKIDFLYYWACLSASYDRNHMRFQQQRVIFYLMYLFKTFYHDPDEFSSDIRYCRYSDRTIGNYDDYISMCLEMKEPISFYHLSKKKTTKLHDETTIKYVTTIVAKQKTKMTIPDGPLKELELPGEFEKLETTGRMYQESYLQHNCVSSYVRKVNDGRCVIFAANIMGERLTIEVCWSENFYYTPQCLQTYNARCSGAVKDYVDRCLHDATLKYRERHHIDPV